MIKNLHLLLVLLGLGFLNVLLGIWVASSEKTNARAIDTLSGQLNEAQHEYQRLATQAGEERSRLSGQLAEARTALTQTQGELSRTRKLLDDLLGKKWLAGTSNDTSPPWNNVVQQLQKEVGSLRTDVNKLLDKSPKPSTEGEKSTP